MPYEMVSFRANGGHCQGYFAAPDGGGKRPAIIVIQEWWGLVPHIKDVAERFVREGFIALAPDLYHGKTATEPDEAGKLAMSLQAADAAKDLDGAIEYLVNHEATLGGKVGIVGFCLGGGLSLYEACHNPDKVAACVVYYGVLPTGQSDLERLKAPLLGLYAEKDGYMPPAQVEELKNRLDSLGKEAEVHVYPNADHAFFNDDRPEVYNAAAADDAWGRTLEFFRDHVR
jgi:carboxymethylenebutenolidase